MKYFFLFFCVGILGSCSLAKESNGLSLMWEKYTFDWIDITIMAPKGLSYFGAGPDSPEVEIQMYPVDRPALVISDTLYRVIINFKKTDSSQMEAEREEYQKSGLYKRSSENGREVFLWLLRKHEKFECYEGSTYSHCRKDIVFNEGQVISAKAEILNKIWHSKAEFERAKKNVELIMNSIEVKTGTSN